MLTGRGSASQVDVSTIMTITTQQGGHKYLSAGLVLNPVFDRLLPSFSPPCPSGLPLTAFRAQHATHLEQIDSVKRKAALKRILVDGVKSPVDSTFSQKVALEQ
jgi:hypothetical protein